MSRFLGPIHYWLFNKIERFEELEEELITGLTTDFGDSVKQIVQQYQQKIGTPVRGQQLEEIIDQANIHGWLQAQITKAETRHAFILTAVFNQFGEKAVNSARTIYARHGKTCGEDAKVNKPVGTAPELFKTLNDYLLDGMPCDNINSLTVQEPGRVEWEHTECLHLRYWEEAKADPKIFYELREIWTNNFIPAANPAFTYHFRYENGLFHHEIVKL